MRGAEASTNLSAMMSVPFAPVLVRILALAPVEAPSVGDSPAAMTTAEAPAASPAAASARAPVPAGPAVEPPARVLPAERAPAPVLGPRFDDAHVDRINRNLRGFGFGFDQGLWGQAMGQTLKIVIPFGKRVGQFLGARLRGMSAFDVRRDGLDPVFGGGLELFGRSPVYLGLVRIYGGGGVWVGGRPGKPAGDATRAYGVTGGGHFGVEFILSSRTTMTFELGGKGPTHALLLDAGATATAGVMVYLGNLRRRGAP